jgi:PAS domain S-box-containing protein
MTQTEIEGALHRLLYVSRASEATLSRFQTEMDAIVTTSQLNNSKLGVTGILISHNGWFVQALEGDRNAVLQLYTEIANDPRHREIRTVSLEPISERRFGQWGMCAGRAPATVTGASFNLTALSSAELISLLSACGPADTQPSLSSHHAQNVLNTLPEQQFDDLASVARTLVGAKAAVIWLTDSHRRWFKSSVGLDHTDLNPESDLFSQSLEAPAALWTADSFEESGVACPPYRFHALAPLEAQGRRIGALCVLDDQPHPFDAGLASALTLIARSIASRLESQFEERIAARLLESAPDAIIGSDADFAIRFWNPAAEHLFGRRAADAIGLSLDMIFPERLRAEYMARLEVLKQGGGLDSEAALELLALGSDGANLPIELSVAIWRDGDRPALGVVIRDCGLRKAAETALMAAKSAAETANVAKSAFLANMSHEIRTPLNGIVGLAAMLSESGLSDRQAEMAQLIQASGDQLQHLLGDVLDLARIEAGAVEIASESFSVADLATSVVRSATPAAERKKLKLEIQLDQAADQRVIGDPVRVKQILSNLLSNAVKFTETGSVVLAISRDENRVYRFAVIDTGIGFDPALKDQLFTHFQQADDTLTRKFGGMGLGLAVCKQVSELLGGEITCHSLPGQGSCFAFLVALDPDTSASDAALDPATLEQRLNVLVADDNPTNRRVVELILSGIDADVVSVENGALAVEAFKQQAFDVVLMDMMMPVMDGLSATQAIRRHEKSIGARATPVLMLSANTLAEHIDAAKLAGVDHYVTKPITAPRLIGAIADLLTPPPRKKPRRNDPTTALNDQASSRVKDHVRAGHR